MELTTPTPDGVTVAEAAQTLGISAESVRRRLRGGTLAGHRVTTPAGTEWRVTLPTVAAVPVPEADAGDAWAAHVETLRATVRRLEAENDQIRADLAVPVATLQATVRRLEAENDQIRADLAARHADVARMVEALAAITTSRLAAPARSWWRVW
jgi:outer membrane murein-binding lipoprotein Lpp